MEITGKAVHSEMIIRNSNALNCQKHKDNQPINKTTDMGQDTIFWNHNKTTDTGQDTIFWDHPRKFTNQIYFSSLFCILSIC